MRKAVLRKAALRNVVMDTYITVVRSWAHWHTLFRNKALFKISQNENRWSLLLLEWEITSFQNLCYFKGSGFSQQLSIARYQVNVKDNNYLEALQIVSSAFTMAMLAKW